MINRHSRRITFLVFYGSVLLLAYLAYRIVEPFLVQIGWALVLAICLDPVQQRLRPRLGSTRTALLLTWLVLVLLVLPVVFAGLALLSEGHEAVTNVRAQLENKGGASAWLHTAWDWARGKVPMLPPEEEAIARVTAGMGNMAGFLASRAGGLVKGAALFIFDLIITLGILFFVLRDSSSFAASFRRLLPFGEDQNERLLALTSDLVSASVTATLAIAAVQGIIGGITFALLGIKSAAVWGLVMAILSFLPLVGATLIWLPAAIWLMLSGSLAKGIILILVGIVILGHVDNVVRPLLLSGKSQMNTLVLIMSLMGGLSAFGFIGIVLGPLVAAVVTALVESYQPPPAVAEPAAAGSGPGNEADVVGPRAAVGKEQ
ncbi:MAG: AI-2E family transporter [Solirubrobacterales bacterium]|jgi:predicted PurR-regulated permease PerM